MSERHSCEFALVLRSRKLHVCYIFDGCFPNRRTKVVVDTFAQSGRKRVGMFKIAVKREVRFEVKRKHMRSIKLLACGNWLNQSNQT